MNKQELQRLCDETLPRVAQEIRDQDIAGWGNACDWAADAIRELLAELAAVTAERDRLREQVPQWIPCSEVTPESGLVIPATVFHEGYALCFRAIPDLPAPTKDQDHE